MWQGFLWDPVKAESNIKDHGVWFEEAATVFDDPLARTVPDVEHSSEEERFVTMGRSDAGVLLVVCHCDRGGRIRIISARFPEPYERRDYESKPEH
jgi:uncharacterized DUF497 family protein